jgi:hypothetical protein
VQATRKRKAATNSQTITPATNQVQPSSNGSTTTTSQKKTLAVSHDRRGYSETNMLTFENCNALPNKDGKMIADDGTVLGVNGKFFPIKLSNDNGCPNFSSQFWGGCSHPSLFCSGFFWLTLGCRSRLHGL